MARAKDSKGCVAEEAEVKASSRREAISYPQSHHQSEVLVKFLPTFVTM